MPRTFRLVACAALWASSLVAQGDSLYGAWCARCHGAGARGTPVASVRTDVPPADLASCPASSAETEDQWVGIVTKGGAAFGLSLDMPAYGDAGTPEQIRMVVRYVRSLCRERGWPPGELNFPRAFLVEKAYPENELVVTAEGRGGGQELIYERRAGRRLQFEAAVSTVFDSLDRPFDHATGAVKYNVWHSLERRAIASVGLEASPPLGRRDRWELEPFLALGFERPDFIVQGEAVAGWEETEGIAAGSLRLGAGRDMDRFVPMVEAGWDWARGSPGILTLYPQTWIKLSKLGHVAGSIGAGIPVNGPGRGQVSLTAFLLWDFGDAPLLKGW